MLYTVWFRACIHVCMTKLSLRLFVRKPNIYNARRWHVHIFCAPVYVVRMYFGLPVWALSKRKSDKLNLFYIAKDNSIKIKANRGWVQHQWLLWLDMLFSSLSLSSCFVLAKKRSMNITHMAVYYELFRLVRRQLPPNFMHTSKQVLPAKEQKTRQTIAMQQSDFR